MIEEWRIVVGHKNYEVSNLGKIRRSVGGQGSRKGCLIGCTKSKYGHSTVHLYDGRGNRFHVFIHRAVAEAFIGLAPTEKHEIAHNDCNATNNVVTNLRWATRKENIADSVRLNRIKLPMLKGEDVGTSVLKEAEVLKIRELYLKKEKSQSGLAFMFNVSRGCITEILHKRTWRHL